MSIINDITKIFVKDKKITFNIQEPSWQRFKSLEKIFPNTDIGWDWQGEEEIHVDIWNSSPMEEYEIIIKKPDEMSINKKDVHYIPFEDEVIIEGNFSCEFNKDMEYDFFSQVICENKEKKEE